MLCPLLFQLTASQGGWRSTTFYPVLSGQFQLTASQGGWRQAVCQLPFFLYFNSQPHKEADAIQPVNHLFFTKFQLTASQGGWPVTSTGIRSHLIFQLTASQGGWRYQEAWADYRYNFNSQPHKEADERASVSSICWVAFQLTASQGGWQHHEEDDNKPWYFNSQPHKEADSPFCGWGRAEVFQLTASQGGWPGGFHL